MEIDERCGESGKFILLWSRRPFYHTHDALQSSHTKKAPKKRWLNMSLSIEPLFDNCICPSLRALLVIPLDVILTVPFGGRVLTHSFYTTQDKPEPYEPLLFPTVNARNSEYLSYSTTDLLSKLPASSHLSLGMFRTTTKYNMSGMQAHRLL